MSERPESSQERVTFPNNSSLAKRIIVSTLAGVTSLVGLHALQGFAGDKANQEREVQASEKRETIAKRQLEEIETGTMRYKIAHLIDHDKGESE